MRLAASSEVEGVHLVACGHCGALNGKTATQCWKCDAELAAPNLLEPAPPLQPPKTPASWWGGPRGVAAPAPNSGGTPPPEAPGPPDQPHDSAAHRQADRAAEPTPTARDSPPSTPEAPPTIAPDDGAEVPSSIWAFADSSSFADHAESVRRKHRRVVSSAMVVVAGVLALSAYFLFRPAAVDEAGWHVTTNPAMTGRVGPGVTPILEGNGSASAVPAPGATVSDGVATSAPLSRPVERSAAAIEPAAAPAAVAPTRSATARRGVSRRAVEPPPPAAADPRSNAPRSRSADEPPPPHPGPCSPSIAALGLCTPEPTQ